jgi:hypothetical protein
MGENIHNIIITSLNKFGNDTNYNYNLHFSNYGIFITSDEEAYLNITSFQSLNSFYNINDNSKIFYITVINNIIGNVYVPFELETGNYDIYNFMEAINNLCSQYFTIEYNEKKNKWLYKKANEFLESIIYIIPNKYNYKYFGLVPDIDNEINNNYSNIINMNSFSLIVIKIIGLVEENRIIDNLQASINRGDICAVVNRQDAAVGSLINWTDINKSFIKKINNFEINSLNFKFNNEFGEDLVDLNDWIITLQIIIKKK